MGFYVKSMIGAVMVVACLVGFNVGLIHLLQTGSCASGNTVYVVQRQCPDGTGLYIAMLVGGIFGTLIGAGIFAFRGQRPGSPARSINDGLAWPLLLWGVGFGATGIVALVASLTGDLPPDGKTGGIIVGITFALMGLPVLIWQLKNFVKGLFGGSERGAGVADRLSRLDALRRSGALTESEFQREKAKL